MGILKSSFLSLSIPLFFCVNSTVAAGKFSVGDRVEADPMQIGKYKTGTVVSVEPNDQYKVKFDDDRPGYDGMICREDKMRKSASAAPQNTQTTTAPQNIQATAAPQNTQATTAPQNIQATAAPQNTQAIAQTAPNFGGLQRPNQTGARVMVDYLKLGVFKPATIVSDAGDGFFKVKLDEDPNNIFIVPKDRMKGGGGGMPAAPVAAVPAQKTPQIGGAANPPAQKQDPGTPAHAGKGAPPDGFYKCNKIGAGGFAGVGGGLEIRGNMYRGIGQGGSFAPYTMNGNVITWTQGLRSLPDNWTLKDSIYYGLDYRGRPLIKIYYRGAFANDCIDCVKQ